MKFLIIVLSTTLGASCVPHKEASPIAQQPKLQKAVQAGNKTPYFKKMIEIEIPQKESELTQTKTVEVPSPTFTGHYAGWLDTNSKLSGHGTISVETIDEKTKTVSVSTLFFGKREKYNLPFKMSDGEKLGENEISVNTKKFNFSSNGEVLTIDLFNGTKQPSANDMHKMTAFKYQTDKRVDHDSAVHNESNREFLSYAYTENAVPKNASTTLLKSEDIENLRAIDLEVMKHEIYARHGAAFKDRRMTNFFSENDWYTPVFTMKEATKNLTKIEVKNINLIRRFEKHAKRYYESFGR